MNTTTPAPIRVAFVCVENAGRSQMAAALAERECARRGLEDAIEIRSGGTRPADTVHEAVVEAMAERDVDLTDARPRAITRADLRDVDVVVTMGCSADGVCPATWEGDARDWDLDDPKSQSLDEVRAIRDEIAQRVEALFDEVEPADSLDPATRRRVVRERYARIATGGESDDGTDTDRAGCCSSDACCNDDADVATTADETARRLGYSAADLDAVAGGANLGLGCGNPQALADLDPGETVLDLGSGGGFDCFLAAREVGETGRVIGVDMTPEMVETARENARENDAENVEFRLGEIEHLPVADATVDAVISNCVVNLSPDKPQVFREAYRVLRPGGRLAISDVVLTGDVPTDLQANPDAVAACVAGAATIEGLERVVTDAGFERVDVAPKTDSERVIREWDDERDLSEFLVSARITGRKPAAGSDEWE